MQIDAFLRAHSWRQYVMKLHDATRLHFDLRLECNGTVRSWALPASFSCTAGAICSATEMLDHKVANLMFEGVHDNKPIMLWDRGGWEPHPGYEDIAACLDRGELGFTLHGERVQGDWTVVRTNRKSYDHPIWTLTKKGGSLRQTGAPQCVSEVWKTSITTAKTMEEIRSDWSTGRKKDERQMRLL